ncbi:hypothetical protein FG379_001234 [Cryptosporidium bovis]|uniref:uncharacterized protein n=1 Tax=Cryptosporidium bovis TaxID=310047 RepID=UPI00351A2C80|nr:hypothetical protein FG379_001234 [Cryptosporidium bovis]
MASEVVISQVLDEIKQSIFLINESLGSEKYDTSDFSVSTVLDVCDIRIVDELPPISPGNGESLFVFPCNESQDTNNRFISNCSNNSVATQQNGASNYILVTAPPMNSAPDESVYDSDGIGSGQPARVETGNYWNYDDCESTSEGSFLSEYESDVRNENETCSNIEDVFDKDIINSESSFRLDLDDKSPKDLADVGNVDGHIICGNYNQIGKVPSRNSGGCNILDLIGRENIGAPQSGCGYSKDKLSSINNDITLNYDSGDVIDTSSFEDVSPRYMTEPGIFKRHIVPDLGGEERRYKTIKCDSQLPICRNNSDGRIFY